MENKFFLSYLKSLNPYYNLAIEAYLTYHAAPDTLLFLIWKNDSSVILGKNQDCLSECRADLIEAEGGYVARRLSGGGAVYQDPGNINFSFICRKEHSDINKQMAVIVEAVRLLGISAEVSGKNDIIVNGRKFSGSAFLETESGYCHHGTMMVAVNIERMERYLNPPQSKLDVRGISSVKSRVINLRDLNSKLTDSHIEWALKCAFEKIYGVRLSLDFLSGKEGKKNFFNQEEIRNWEKTLASREWIYGRRSNGGYCVESRFPWGGIKIWIQLKEKQIIKARVFSDATNLEIASQVEKRLNGCLRNIETLKERFATVDFEGKEEILELLERNKWIWGDK
jgi:lipoate-protein ligase A